jgi:hypothetical protein
MEQVGEEVRQQLIEDEQLTTNCVCTFFVQGVSMLTLQTFQNAKRKRLMFLLKLSNMYEKKNIYK